MAEEAGDDKVVSGHGHSGPEARLKPGKTFYKGRNKQVSRDRNPSQWSAYYQGSRATQYHTTQQHSPLEAQLADTRETGILSRKTRTLPSITTGHAPSDDDGDNDNDDEEDDDHKRIDQRFLDAKDTDKILKLAKQQMDESTNNDTEAVHDETNAANGKAKASKTSSSSQPKSQQLFQIESRNISLQDILGDDDDAKTEMSEFDKLSPADVEEVELHEDDERALEKFMPASKREQVTLADIIMKRMAKKEEDNISQLHPNKIIQKKIPKRVIVVYRDCAEILTKWRSGRMPKAFKVIPQLQDWEEVLYLTNPDEWTPAVHYQSVKLFVSQANPIICQRYVNTILLPVVRDDILVHKKLNFHLYQAVRKALFKPQAFFRGFLLPLCSDELSGREAVILGGILGKNSIPVIQSALAIYKMLELEFSGSVHYLLKVLLNKRYALPVKVIDALVAHFKKFENDPRQMTVIWHQTFLVFAERYKKSLTKQQRFSLKNVLKKQFHPQITPSIRKELFESIKEKITSMDIDI